MSKEEKVFIEAEPDMNIELDTGEWSIASDVVVVGGGGCGLSAALAAAMGGAEVMVIEKQARPWSNTARSGGMIPAAGTRFQRAAGIEDRPEDFAADILHKNRHSSDPDLTMRLAQTSADLVEWLVDAVGVRLVLIDDFKYPGHTRFRMHAPPSRTGAELVADLRRAAMAHQEIILANDAPAVGLMVDSAGVVTGVLARQGGSIERIRAGATILACNGFAGNPAMVAHYCPEIAGALYFGGEGNTGEGILWGLELGADVAYMDAFQAHASVAVPHNILITYAVISAGGFQVNRAGQRFGNEAAGYSEHALAVLAQPNGVAWNIYDERIHNLGLEFADYREAVEAGAVRRGETLTELAEVLGIDAGGLAITLAEYHAAAGEPADRFGRRVNTRFVPPFYGVKVSGALFHTQGGLRVDGDGRVLRPSGEPIPRLYAGGGAAMGISGNGAGGYLSGNGLLTALGLGMLAGRHAAMSMQNAKFNMQNAN